MRLARCCVDGTDYCSVLFGWLLLNKVLVPVGFAADLMMPGPHLSVWAEAFAGGSAPTGLAAYRDAMLSWKAAQEQVRRYFLVFGAFAW